MEGKPRHDVENIMEECRLQDGPRLLLRQTQGGYGHIREQNLFDSIDLVTFFFLTTQMDPMGFLSLIAIKT